MGIGRLELKEKVWIYIPQNYKEMLIQWKKYYIYDTEDDAKDSYVVGTEYDRCDKCGAKKLSLDGSILLVLYCST